MNNRVERTNARMLAGTQLLIPVNRQEIPTSSGWGASHSGSGAVTSSAFSQQLSTGTTASSRGLMQVTVAGFSVSNHWAYVSWNKKLYIVFNYARESSDAQVIARFQLKEANTEGQLAALGVGLQVDNYALTLETYGTARGTVDLSTTLTSSTMVRIVIVHTPSIPKIECYVDGVLKGTQSTSANIPQAAGNPSYCVHSIINGVTGGVDAVSILAQPVLWQER